MRHHFLATISALALLSPGCVASRSGTPSDSTAAETSSERTPRESILEAFALFTASGRTPARTVLAELRRLDGKTAGAEGRFIKELVPLVSTLTAPETNISTEDMRKVANLMQEFGKIFPRDFTVQQAVVTGIFTLDSYLASGEGAAGEGGDPAKASIARAENFATSFPMKAEVYAHLGRVHEAKGKSTLDALRSYGRCLELAPETSACRSRFTALAIDFERERCGSFKRGGFALNAAHSKEAKGTKPISHAGAKAHLDAKPIFTGEHVQDLHESKQEDGTSLLVVELTPTAAARFAAVTEALAKESGYLAIYLGGKLHALPRVMTSIDSGQVHVMMLGKPVPWGLICDKFESRKLPAELARFKAK